MNIIFRRSFHAACFVSGAAVRILTGILTEPFEPFQAR